MSEQTRNSVNTFRTYPSKFSELPVDVIETDSGQPRKAFGLKNGSDFTRLLKSIQLYGIEEPIKVSEDSEGRYIIMDGHRRFACAKELKFEKILCRIYPKMSDGEFEARRFEMQNNRKSWKHIEKANAIHRIRTEFNNASQKDIADLIGIKQSSLFHYTGLRDMRMEYLELMSEHNLREYQRVGFMRLLPKLRKINEFQIDDIVKIIFLKINDNLLYRENDFSTLSRIFETASLFEEEITRFLLEPQISVVDLHEMTQLSGISIQIKNLIKELTMKKNQDIKLTTKEQSVFENLYKLMETFK